MSNGGEPTGEGVNVEGTREYLAQSPVVFAVLFGSHARGTTSSDVDIALQFPAAMNDHDCFRRRNQIDAALQAYAEGYVDVSDIETLPTPVAHTALRDGILLAGDEQTVEAYTEGGRSSVRSDVERTRTTTSGVHRSTRSGRRVMVDEEVVVDTLWHINEYTNDLKQMRGMSKENYVGDVVTLLATWHSRISCTSKLSLCARKDDTLRN